GGYALGLCWRQGRGEEETTPDRGRRGVWLALAVVTMVIAWTVATIGMARLCSWIRIANNDPLAESVRRSLKSLFHVTEVTGKPMPALPWMYGVPLVILAAWGIVAVWLLVRWRSRGWRSPLMWMLLGLSGSALLAAVLSAAQLLPVYEFTQQTSRAASDG